MLLTSRENGYEYNGTQEKLLFALAGGHNCEGCEDPDDLFTLTEKDLKETEKDLKNGVSVSG